MIGGRSEVLNTPVVDLFGYLILHFEKQEEEANQEAQRLYLNHLSRAHANPQSKEQAKASEKFQKAINPFDKRVNKNGPRLVNSSKKLEWDDLDKMKRLENL